MRTSSIAIATLALAVSSSINPSTALAKESVRKASLSLRHRALDQTENENTKEAQKGRYPYLAALFKKASDGSLKQSCGGALIAPNVIVTAASCLDSVDVAYLGLHDSLDMEEGTYEVFDISADSKHQRSLDTNTTEEDIALLFLDRNSTFSPVSINTRSDVPQEGQELVNIGWDTTESDAVSSVRMETIINILSQSECAADHPSMNVTSMLCTSGGESLDRGGPLIVKGEEAGQDILVGVASLESGVYSSVLHSLTRNPSAPSRTIKSDKLSRCYYEWYCEWYCDCCWCEEVCVEIWYC